jgi:hypothetical protein
MRSTLAVNRSFEDLTPASQWIINHAAKRLGRTRNRAYLQGLHSELQHAKNLLIVKGGDRNAIGGLLALPIDTILARVHPCSRSSHCDSPDS